MRNSSSSNSSGSCTDDTVADATDSIALVSDLPQEFHKAYQELVPVLGYSDAQFTELVSCPPCPPTTDTASSSSPFPHPCTIQEVATLENTLSEIKALLRGVIGVGYSRQWAEFDKLLALRQRISDIIDAKKAAAPPRKIEVVDLQGVPGLEFARQTDWVAVRLGDWPETSEDVADTSYLTNLYRNAAAPSVFGWEDFGAGSSEEPEIGDHPGINRTLDYLSF